MQAQSTPVHVPSDVVAYFRAGGRIVRTIYCNQHGRTTSIVPFGGGCVVCEFERRNRGAGS